MRGPLKVDNIAVYQPLNVSGATWKLTSSWTLGSQPKNLTFLMNNGNWSSRQHPSTFEAVSDKNIFSVRW